MPIVFSQYWNVVHGNTPDEVRQDEEGLQIMRTLGSNMAWLLQRLEKTKESVPRPEPEKLRKLTNLRNQHPYKHKDSRRESLCWRGILRRKRAPQPPDGG
jgi:hypothetical protein